MNYKKYFFEDFTFENYRIILKKLLEHYNCLLFSDNLKIDKFFIMRHDVDHSVENSFKMAEIENELGIKSTYFIHLHNEFYNFLELEHSKTFKKIIDLGHEIALHFDVHYYNINNENELEKHLLFEKNIIESILNVKIKVFSFHNNNDFTLSCKKEKYAGLINVYNDYFFKNMKYCSDSNGYWRFERLVDLIDTDKYSKLHILLHPELWQNRPMSPKERIHYIADKNSERIKKIYDDHLIEFGRENIDW